MRNEIIFDLQLFAEMNTNTTSDNTVGNDLSPTMKTFYDTDLLQNARPHLYFGQFGKKVTLPKNHGKKVEWRRFLTFGKALTPLKEGVTPDGNKVDMVSIEQEIKQYGDYTTISDRLELEAVDPVVMAVTEEHGAQAGETLDTVIRNEVLTGTHVAFANGKTSRYALTGEDKITANDVARWNTFLKKMKAPKYAGNDFVAIIHPSVAEDLRLSDGWMEAHKYAAPEEIFNGEIGKLHNIRFVESTEQKVYKGDDLAATARNLTVNAVATATDTITVAEDLVVNALAGRLVLIGGAQFEVVSNEAKSIKLIDPLTGVAAAVTAAKNDVIYPGEGGAEGTAVYAVTIMGKEAYGIIDPEAESLEVIVKQRGSAGTADPLNQRSTVGWKASEAAKILYQERLLRFECGSSYSDVDDAN